MAFIISFSRNITAFIHEYKAILKESIIPRQIIACIIAGIGVLNLTLSFGVFPCVSFILATTFAIYGILKKAVDIGTYLWSNSRNNDRYTDCINLCLIFIQSPKRTLW